MKIDLNHLAKLAKKAGRAILEVYKTEFAVEEKTDLSPITLADRLSHEIITHGLQERYPDIPILSEEGREIPYAQRREWARFWLVDPLDGTKEFVKRNGEFSVNIALVQSGRPIVGLIQLPVLDRLYAADVREGCWEATNRGWRPLCISNRSPDEPVRVLKSRSHPSPKLDELLGVFPSIEVITRGSALKFCAVILGEADFYPRLAGTWEWDTAAGEALVTAAGGVMVDPQGKPFAYNKPHLRNGPFLVARNREWLIGSGVLRRAAATLGLI